MPRFPLKTLHRYFLLSLAIFTVVQTLKFFDFNSPTWVFNYLNDFLTLPIVATFCLHGIWLVKKDQTIRLNRWTILSLVALYSLYFEIYLPQLSHRYTSDYWDILCYLFGGLVFYVLQKKH